MTAPSTARAPAGAHARGTPRYRLAVLTSHVIQNQDPMFRQIAAHPEIDLEVLFCSRMGAESYRDKDLGVQVRWDLDLLQGYRYRFLRNVSPASRGIFRLVNPGVISATRRGRYDAVAVMGWGSVSAWLAFLACAAFGVPFFICGDSSFVVESRTPKGRLRRALLRGLFARAAGFLTMGTMNGDFYRHYGADRRRLFHVPYAIDNDRFARESRLTADERCRLRERHGIDCGRVVVAFSGKLMPLKNPAHLLMAVERMRHRDGVAVVYLGDGVERRALEQYARAAELTAVHFLGFLNQRELPRAYAMADVLVLPSTRDHRGTVVNEAMACGLPVVVSDQVGVYGEGDIVRHGENGFVYPVGDLDRLASYLDTLVGDAELRRRMGARSREIIGTWSFATDVEGILAALRSLDARGTRS